MKLPLIGLGTWELNGAECTEVVRMALEFGYRHIDTAHAYHNHAAIKKGIAGFDRAELYLTSKLSIEDQVHLNDVEGSVRAACEQTLTELGVEYLDLYLIHWPRAGFDLNQIFTAMGKLALEGKVRQVGVCNYTVNHLRDLLKTGAQPVVNQVEFHPYLHQKELLDFCHINQIQLVSFRPFGKGKLLSIEPLFQQIGDCHGKTGAQVILKWLVQKNIPVIPKASSRKHLEENIQIFDFTLSDVEMAQLDQLDRGKRFCKADSPEYNY